MELLPNEGIVLDAKRLRIVVTNFRIRKGLGNSLRQSICLNEVSYCGAKAKEDFRFLIGAALVPFAAWAFKDTFELVWLVIGSIVLFLVLIGLYFASRKRMLLIKSSGGQISSEFVSDFKEAINVIDVIERLKIENMRRIDTSFRNDEKYYSAQLKED